MKIAIQGHLTRGKEVIQILESLGGKNTSKLSGCSKTFYHIDKGEICNDHYPPVNYKFYTLEEFEKEFPFKIGDKVTVMTDTIHKVVALEYYMSELCYKLNNGLHYSSEMLTLGKEMKEERNITLTLDKAKEWYQKGGELKEIALQAFTEEELHPLPKSWEEYCKMYPGPITKYLSVAGCPQKYIALWKLEQLRDCYRQGWKPDSGYFMKFCIIKELNTYKIVQRRDISKFLSFRTHDITNEFLKNFEPLIKEAGDLI